ATEDLKREISTEIEEIEKQADEVTHFPYSFGGPPKEGGNQGRTAPVPPPPSPEVKEKEEDGA
ncbi:MAG: hypothetical protein QHH30_10735, partial [candidate division NC10 bacterium]|nr:hypothetical protein [candidate division NC10 bacterium]